MRSSAVVFIVVTLFAAVCLASASPGCRNCVGTCCPGMGCCPYKDGTCCVGEDSCCQYGYNCCGNNRCCPNAGYSVNATRLVGLKDQ